MGHAHCVGSTRCAPHRARGGSGVCRAKPKSETLLPLKAGFEHRGACLLATQPWAPADGNPWATSAGLAPKQGPGGGGAGLIWLGTAPLACCNAGNAPNACTLSLSKTRGMIRLGHGVRGSRDDILDARPDQPPLYRPRPPWAAMGRISDPSSTVAGCLSSRNPGPWCPQTAPFGMPHLGGNPVGGFAVAERAEN